MLTHFWLRRDIALAAVVSRQEAALFFPPHLKNDPELFGKAVEVRHSSCDSSRH